MKYKSLIKMGRHTHQKYASIQTKKKVIETNHKKLTSHLDVK